MNPQIKLKENHEPPNNNIKDIATGFPEDLGDQIASLTKKEVKNLTEYIEGKL